MLFFNEARSFLFSRFSPRYSCHTKVFPRLVLQSTNVGLPCSISHNRLCTPCRTGNQTARKGGRSCCCWPPLIAVVVVAHWHPQTPLWGCSPRAGAPPSFVAVYRCYIPCCTASSGYRHRKQCVPAATKILCSVPSSSSLSIIQRSSMCVLFPSSVYYHYFCITD